MSRPFFPQTAIREFQAVRPGATPVGRTNAGFVNAVTSRGRMICTVKVSISTATDR
jgi:hypothetical protein